MSSTASTGSGSGSGEREHSALDAALLRALQADGRASISDLAQSLGATRELVSRRLKHLRANLGVRVVAALDPSFAGHNVLTHTSVSVHGPVRAVAAAIAELPQAVFVSLTGGAFPLVLESRHADAAELDALLETVRSLPGVEQMQVSTYSEVLKGFFMSATRPTLTPDALDERIIAVLQGDGRASYQHIADAVHLSPSSARERVQKLLAGGVIKISAIQEGGISRSRLAVGVGVHTRGPAAAIRAWLRSSPAVAFAAQSHGSYDFIATVMGTTSEDLLVQLEALRALDGVGSLATWSHLDILKEDYRRATGQVPPARQG